MRDFLGQELKVRDPVIVYYKDFGLCQAVIERFTAKRVILGVQMNNSIIEYITTGDRIVIINEIMTNKPELFI